MKRIVQLAVVALSCSASLAWSQQEEITQAQGSPESVSVAQASTSAERASIQREEPIANPRKPSMHEMSGLAGEGAFPSRGGPLDD